MCAFNVNLWTTRRFNKQYSSSKLARFSFVSAGCSFEFAFGINIFKRMKGKSSWKVYNIPKKSLSIQKQIFRCKIINIVRNIFSCYVSLTWRRHLMRSPGAMMTVVINPERNPADASWVGFSASSGEDCWIFFPIPNPMKLMAKMGATPTRGAPMPEKKPNIILTPIIQ